MQADYTALREGSLFELVNLVNWNNVRIEFKAASLQCVHGAEALLRLLAGRWLADIRSNQAVRVLEGATPVASFVRLGTAVHRLASHAATMPIAKQVCSCDREGHLCNAVTIASIHVIGQWHGVRFFFCASFLQVGVPC